MKVVAISDLHGHLPKVENMPEGEVLAIAGDLCPGKGLTNQFSWLDEAFRAWLALLPYRHVVATWGNHDWAGEYTSRIQLLRLPVHWLVDSGVVLEGVRFWGAPWTMPINHWAFMKPDHEASRHWDKIWDDADVVVVHGPPFGVGDLTTHGDRPGSRSLRARLEVVQPQLAVFGHIHEAFGRSMQPGGVWANVSSCNRRYELANPPQVFEVARSVRATQGGGR
jgi:Icc-related predicted phosphoesterase